MGHVGRRGGHGKKKHDRRGGTGKKKDRLKKKKQGLGGRGSSGRRGGKIKGSGVGGSRNVNEIRSKAPPKEEEIRKLWGFLKKKKLQRRAAVKRIKQGTCSPANGVRKEGLIRN